MKFALIVVAAAAVGLLWLLTSIAEASLLVIPFAPAAGNFLIVCVTCALTHRSRVGDLRGQFAEFTLANAVGMFLISVGFYIGALAEIADRRWQQAVDGFPLPGSAPDEVFRAFFDKRSPAHLENPDLWILLILVLLAISMGAAVLTFFRMVTADRAVEAGIKHTATAPVVAFSLYFLACLSFALFLFIAYPWTRSKEGVDVYWVTALAAFVVQVLVQVLGGIFVTGLLRANRYSSPTPSSETPVAPSEAKPAEIATGLTTQIRRSRSYALWAAILVAAAGAIVFWPIFSDAVAKLGLDMPHPMFAALVGLSILLVLFPICYDWLADRPPGDGKNPPAVPPKSPSIGEGSDPRPTGEGQDPLPETWWRRLRRRWVWPLLALILLIAIASYWCIHRETSGGSGGVGAVGAVGAVGGGGGGGGGGDGGGLPVSVCPLDNQFTVQFDRGSSILNQQGLAEAARAAACYNEKKGRADSGPNMDVSVNGEADQVGGAANNQRLSEDRANAVRAKLESEGVPAKAIKTKGIGESKAELPEENPRFRRATIVIRPAGPPPES